MRSRQCSILRECVCEWPRLTSVSVASFQCEWTESARPKFVMNLRGGAQYIRIGRAQRNGALMHKLRLGPAIREVEELRDEHLDHSVRAKCSGADPPALPRSLRRRPLGSGRQQLRLARSRSGKISALRVLDLLNELLVLTACNSTVIDGRPSRTRPSIPGDHTSTLASFIVARILSLDSLPVIVTVIRHFGTILSISIAIAPEY